jgi:hypothetical protein
MQPYITPHPGRTPPREMIVNRSDYKLDFTLTEFRQNQYLLAINKFIPETGWCEQKFFLTPEELARIQDVINEPR